MKTKVARVGGGILQLVKRGSIMEGILFGFFLGALAGGAAAKVILRVLRDRKAAAFNRLVMDMLPDDPTQEGISHNLMSHNNLDWMKTGASE